MKIIRKVAEMQALSAFWRSEAASIGLVPTMGNLHQGHLKLCRQARQHSDRVVVSLFVNPLQFGPQEDFAAYPRTEKEDLEQLASLSVDAVFIPNPSEMYPPTEKTRISLTGLVDECCGKSRPGHFNGVATVVLKLFNIVQAQIAIFGEKDYQQLLVIRQMVKDLNHPITILSHPTVREADGLALSSRNFYLTAEERKIAPKLYQTLTSIAADITSGNRNFTEQCKRATSELEKEGFIVDYVTVRAAHNLEEPHETEQNLLVLAAAFLGRPRLIDNISLTTR